MNKISPPSNRVDFVDWLKAIGMFLIVFGHFFGDPYNQLTQPIYPKQLGVVLFVFVMGWGLGSAHGNVWNEAYKRVFPMFFWGGLVAAVISIISLIITKDLRLSNYSPFVFGVNVAFNTFPSNPTTWFIGTYLHIILLWAILLNRIKITVPILVASLFLELFFRATLIYMDTLFIAYMTVPNWITVFLFGMYMRETKDKQSHQGLAFYIAAWVIFTGIWAFASSYLEVGRRFPFRSIKVASDLYNAVFESTCISILYLGHCYFFVSVFQRITANFPVRFFSRNTIIVFIMHMPFYAVAEPIASLFVASGWGKRLIIVMIMFVGLSALSELLSRLIHVDKLRDYMWEKINLKKA
jgi:hypothetical protein